MTFIHLVEYVFSLHYVVISLENLPHHGRQEENKNQRTSHILCRSASDSGIHRLFEGRGEKKGTLVRGSAPRREL